MCAKRLVLEKSIYFMLNIKSFLIEKVGDLKVRDICINVYTGLSLEAAVYRRGLLLLQLPVNTKQ